ncbi:Single-strand annealing protein SAK3 [Candidatus Methylopumilus planktonicus]
MVFCKVTAFGKSRIAQLPVMDFRNQAIPNPNAYQVNTAMQRCLAKAISLHGIGLYIYAGEDLPTVDQDIERLYTELEICLDPIFLFQNLDLQEFIHGVEYEFNPFD